MRRLSRTLGLCPGVWGGGCAEWLRVSTQLDVSQRGAEASPLLLPSSRRSVTPAPPPFCLVPTTHLLCCHRKTL